MHTTNIKSASMELCGHCCYSTYACATLSRNRRGCSLKRNIAHNFFRDCFYLFLMNYNSIYFHFLTTTLVLLFQFWCSVCRLFYFGYILLCFLSHNLFLYFLKSSLLCICRCMAIPYTKLNGLMNFHAIIRAYICSFSYCLT